MRHVKYGHRQDKPDGVVIYLLLHKFAQQKVENCMADSTMVEWSVSSRFRHNFLNLINLPKTSVATLKILTCDSHIGSRYS